MGAKNSGEARQEAHVAPQHNTNASRESAAPKSSHSSSTAPPVDIYGNRAGGAALSPPLFAGFSAESARHRIVSDELAAAIHNALPALPVAPETTLIPGGAIPGGTTPAFLMSPGLGGAGQSPAPAPTPRMPETPTWYLLFNSNIHGRSFNRMLQLCCERGPVVFAIREANSQKRVFGGFNVQSWLGVAAREKATRSVSAAQHRAARVGGSTSSSGPTRPDNQSPQFFGDDRCFLFTDTVPSSGEKVPASEGGALIYRGKTSINSNFMYLFDTHPDEDKIGIGMGGQPMRHGWFVDRWLEQGHCRGTTCTTFGNPALSQTETFTVDAIEVFAVDPVVVQALIDEHGDGEIATGAKSGAGVLQRGSETNCDKMLLQLHMNHHFYSERVVDDDPRDTPEHSDSKMECSGGGDKHLNGRTCDGSLY